MKNLLLITCGLLWLTSCGNGDSAGEAHTTTAFSSTTGSNVITFKVDGAEVRSAGWNIGRYQFSNMEKPGLNITTDMHVEKRTINVNLNGTSAGTYTFDGGSAVKGTSLGMYFPDYGDNSNAYQISSGSFVLTEVDTAKGIVNGSFSFTAKNSEGKAVTVTDGKIINGALKPGITNGEM